MNYFNFIKNSIKHLKSVRVIKDYISFDMIFPNTWTILKEHTKDIEIIKNNSQEDNKVVISFVTPFNENSINNVETSVNSIIKFNVEKEEKERLFKSKVQELRSIFEKQKLDNLKSLKFDINEFTLMSVENDEDDSGNTERDGEDETRERKKSTEPQES
jgi:predicted nuclease of predicted toxin-antitoxin system